MKKQLAKLDVCYGDGRLCLYLLREKKRLIVNRCDLKDYHVVNPEDVKPMKDGICPQ